MSNDLVARLRIEGEAAGAVKAANDTGEALKKVGAQGSTAKRGLEDAGAGARTLETNAKGASMATKALGTALGYLGLRELTRNITDAAFAAKGFETGLGAVAGGAMGARTEMAFIREETARLGLDLRKAEQSFLSLAGATNGTALAGEQTRKIWTSVMETGLAMGRSNEQIQRGLEAISQVASKGVVSMEEVRGQLAEAIPGAVNIASRAMGVSTAEMNKMIASGDLLASTFLPKFAAQLQSEFGPAVEKYLTSDIGRARQEIGQLQTALFDLSAAAGESFLSGVVDGFSDLNETLSGEELAKEVRALAHELGELAGEGARALALLADNADLVVIALGALVGLRAGAAVAAIGTAAITAAEGVGVLGAAMSALGGPIGIVAGIGVAAVTALNLSFAEQEEKVRAASVAQDEHNQLMGDAAQLLKDAGVNAKQWGLNIGGGVSPTNDLAGATRGLADETFRLADARRQAAVEELRANSAKLQTQIDDIERRKQTRDRMATPGWIQLFGTPEQKAAHSARINAGDNATQDALRGQIASNMAAGIALTLAPEAKPKAAAHEEVATAAGKRAKKTDEAREAERRLAAAKDMIVQAQLETQALADRAVAAMKGEEALEALRISEAGMRVLERQGVASIGELTGKVREQTEAAIKAAEAQERQAIVTEKAERVGATARDLDEAAVAEKRRATAIAGGSDALVLYARAEFVRQEVEKAGKLLTQEQIALLKQKADQLYTLQAVNEEADFTRQQAEELRLMSMTNDERDLEERKLRIRNALLKEGRDIVEAEIDARALVEQGAADNAEAVARLKEDLRQAFIETGEVSFDSVADYAEKRLRQAVYDALLAKPIDVLINAVVGNVSGLGGLAGQLAGGGGAIGGLASALGGRSGVAGILGAGGSLLGAGSILGAGSAGLFGGTTIAPMVLQSALGTSIAGTVGTAGGLGGFLSGMGGALATNPVGWAVAGAAALAAIFSGAKKPSNNGALATFDGDSYGLSGSKRNDETTRMATSAADAILSGEKILQDAGIKLTATVKSIDIGTRDATDIILSDGRALTSAVGDAAAAASTALNALLDGATYTSDAQKALVQSMRAAGAGFDDIATSLQTYQAAQNLSADFASAIQKITDPKAYAKAQLEAEQAARRSQVKGLYDELMLTAEQFASLNSQLDKLESLELVETLKAFGDSADTAREALRTSWQAESAARQQSISELKALISSLSAYRKSLYTGAAAGLSPEEQYNVTKAEFLATKARSDAGDKDAAAALLTLGPQFLEASRAYNGSSAAYFQDLELVRQAVTSAESLAEQQLSVAEQQLAEIKKSVELLIDIKAGVLTLADAIAGVEAAIAAQTKAAAGSTSIWAPGSPSTNLESLPAGWTAQGYAAKNPDLAENYNNGGVLSQFATFEEALRYHAMVTGLPIEGRKFAAGGIFDAGIVSQPTNFDIGTMGEAGPEAIMPLFRGPNGLGVAVSNDNRRTEALLEQVLVELQALVLQGGAVGSRQIAALQAVAEELSSTSRELARAA